ncbi:MAG: hypothetical protein HYY06_06985 [Deltaproteobacteria bacterium]|nr:hypothetical protein [Deltaproteobacteria bacterium]
MCRRLPALLLVLALASCQEGSVATGPAVDAGADGDSDGDSDSDSDSDSDADADGDGDADPGADAGPEGPAGSFWRIERPADSERTWLVDPGGNRTFLLGVNTVMRNTTRDGQPRCAGIVDYIRRTDPSTAAHLEWARLSDGESGGQEVRRPYGFNSVGAWSEPNDFDDGGGDSYMIRPPEAGGPGAPYMVVLSTTPGGADRALADEGGSVLENGVGGEIVGDPWNPTFLADLDAMVARDVSPRRDDPRLQMWFLGNEDGMFDMASHDEGVRDFRRWLWSPVPAGSSIDAPLCARHALAAFLRERHPDIAALNAAWESSHADFASIVDAGPRPVPYEHDCNLPCREDLQRFVHDRLITQWVRAVTTRVRAADPNHLVASPRLALGGSSRYRFWAPRSGDDPDIWVDSGNAVGTDTDQVTYCPFDLLGRDGDAGFDVVAVNVYDGDATFERPWFTDGIHKIQDLSGLPVIVSEFSVRARIEGWSNRGGAGAFVPDDDGTDDQIQRGARYQSQIDQLIGFRHIIGASWHAWSDRYMPDDESLQIDMGLAQCADPARGMEAGERWPELDDRIAETNTAIMDLIAAKTGL